MARNQGILSIKGFTGLTGGPLLLWFEDRADSIAIGRKSTLFGKSHGFR